VAWAKAYLHAKWHLDPSSRFVTIHNTPTSKTGQTGQDRPTDNSPIAQDKPFYKWSSKNSMGLTGAPPENRQHSQIKTEHFMSFWRCLSKLKRIWCVIYLASENYTVSYAYFMRQKNYTGCLGVPEACWSSAG